MRENGNSFEVQWAYELVFALHLYTRGIPLIIQTFDATNFGEGKENQTV